MKDAVALTDRLVTGYFGNLTCTLGEFIDANSDAFEDEEIIDLMNDLARSGWAEISVHAGSITLRLVTREVPDFEDCIDLVSWLADRGNVRVRTPLGHVAVEYQAVVDAARALRARENAGEGEAS